MNRDRIVVAVGLAVVGVVVLAAVAGGLGPLVGDGGGEVDDFPTATGTPSPGTGVDDGTSGEDGGGGDAASGGTTGEPFALRIESVDSCGQTCRDVTATLVNRQERRATGTTVYTRIHAGNGTDGDVVWEGSHEVGVLDAGGSDTATQRVELSYFDAMAIQREDGWVTIVTSVDTDRRTVTFRERRAVA